MWTSKIWMFESWKHVEPFTNEEVNAGSWCMCIYVCVCLLEWVIPFLYRHCPKKRYISHIPFIAVAAGPLRMGLDEGGDLLQVPFVRSAEPKLEVPTIGDSHWNLDVAREVPFETYPCAWWSMFGYAVMGQYMSIPNNYAEYWTVIQVPTWPWPSLF